MSERIEARLLVDARCQTGASPCWNAHTRRMVWIDRAGRRLLSCDADGGRPRSRALSASVLAFAFADDGRIIAGFEDGIGWLDPVRGSRTVFEPFSTDQPGAELREAALDAQGRLLLSGRQGGAARLWRLDRGRFALLGEAIAGTAALAVAPEGGALFVADGGGAEAPPELIRYRYDAMAGRPEEAEAWAALPPGGRPGGAAIDREGGVWVALGGLGQVLRIGPDGRVGAAVAVPVAHPTGCCFGGIGLRQLYITTASVACRDGTAAGAPGEGALFVATPPVPGHANGPYRR